MEREGARVGKGERRRKGEREQEREHNKAVKKADGKRSEDNSTGRRLRRATELEEEGDEKRGRRKD